MNDELAYMKEHPPRCLAGAFKPPSPDLEEFLRAQIGAHATIFSAVCTCGSPSVEVEFGPSGVTEITCADCAETRTVFNPQDYGYDGELGLHRGAVGSPLKKHACPECESASCELALGFQYSGETDVLQSDDRGLFKRLLERLARRLLGLTPTLQPEDLFGWVMCAARCGSCGAIRMVVDHECA